MTKLKGPREEKEERSGLFSASRLPQRETFHRQRERERERERDVWVRGRREAEL